MFMVHDDAPYEEVPLGFPPPNNIGPYLNVQGPFSIYGTGVSPYPSIYVATSSNSFILAFNAASQGAITATQATSFTISQGAAGAQSVQMQSGAINFGASGVTRMTLQNGNPVLQINSIAGNQTLGVIGAAGASAINVTVSGVQVGNPTGGEIGNGAINVAKGYYINGVPISTASAAPAGSQGAYFSIAEDQYWEEEIFKGPLSACGSLTVNGSLLVQSAAVSIAGATPPVTVGQTAMGTTTTATVITTAGGIALPALASTFWVVNVNGVQYGIPCFAL
jgi:hypothetical protein